MIGSNKFLFDFLLKSVCSCGQLGEKFTQRWVLWGMGIFRTNPGLWQFSASLWGLH